MEMYVIHMGLRSNHCSVSHTVHVQECYLIISDDHLPLPPDYTVDTNLPCFSQDHPSNNYYYGRDLLDLCWASRIHLVSISSERLGMWSERLTIWLLLRPQSNRPHLHFKCGC